MVRCYTCNQIGHYKDSCPQKHKKVKCYHCKKFGHFQEKCPVKREEVFQLKLEHERKCHERWFEENMPDQPRTISNIEEIKQFFENSLNREFINLHTEDNTYKCYFEKPKFSRYSSSNLDEHWNSALQRKLDGMTVDMFIDFLSQKGAITKLSHFVETFPGMMVRVLFQGNPDIMSTSREGKYTYHYINKERVMYEFDSRGPETVIENPNLIKIMYKKFSLRHNTHVNIINDKVAQNYYFPFSGS